MPQDTPRDIANATTMRAFVIRFVSLAGLACAALLGGCQGNLGSGSGINIPQTQPYGQPPGPGGGAAPQSRQRTLDGAVYLTPEMATLPLPVLGGFAITLQLGAAPPSPSPKPSATASPSPMRSSVARRTKLRAVASAAPLVEASAAATSVPSALASTSAAPSPNASGSPLPTASGSASPRAGSPAPAHSAAAVPKSVTKLVVYPEDAPPAPTPQPAGAVQSYPVRKALVRGVLKPASDVTLYGLAAVKFTIPTEEDTASRGYTVAVFTAGRRHHDALVVSDTRAVATAHVVSSNALDSLVLKRNTTYLFVLYGDDVPGAPGVPAGYPSPGINPFVTPQPGSAPGTSLPPGSVGPGNVGPGTVPTPTGTFVH